MTDWKKPTLNLSEFGEALVESFDQFIPISSDKTGEGLSLASNRVESLPASGSHLDRNSTAAPSTDPFDFTIGESNGVSEDHLTWALPGNQLETGDIAVEAEEGESAPWWAGSRSSVWISFAVHCLLFLVLAISWSGASQRQGPITLVLMPEKPTRKISLEFRLPITEIDPSQFAETQLVTAPAKSSELQSHQSFAKQQQAVDAARLPETSYRGFFGIEPEGGKVAYLIDMSTTMQNGRTIQRFDRAVRQVLSSIDELSPEQEFFVCLFCSETNVMKVGDGGFCKASESNKLELRQWLVDHSLAAGTDPREALMYALQQNPSCVYLLSDGQFNGKEYGTGRFGKQISAIKLAKALNRNRCPIHTIGLEDESNQMALHQIANDSDGIYLFVPSIRD